MKKAKIVLTVITIFSVVGVTMAFKAYRGGGLVFTPNAQGICNVSVRTYTTIPNSNPSTTIIGATVSNSPCFILQVYPTAQ